MALGGALLASPAQAATFEVDSLADAAADGCNVGTCTLRDAVEDANGDDVVDVITFEAGLTGQIRLTEGVVPIDAGLDIRGPGAGVLAISGDANDDGLPDGGDSRIFYVDPEVAGDPGDPVTIAGLTLTEGYAAANGGAVYSYESDLTLEETVVTESYAANKGGGVAINFGTVTITGSRFSENDSADYAGGLFVYYTSGGAGAHVTIRDSVMRDNDGGSDGGAFYLDSTDGDIIIADTTISGNDSGEDGGGGVISHYGPGTGSTTITRTTFSGNEAAGIAGGLWLLGPDEFVAIANSTFHNNEAGTYGGGIAAYNGADVPVTILGSTITGNTAVGRGGGIYRYAKDSDPGGTDTMFLRNSIVAGNSSADSGDDLGERDTPIDAFDLGFSLVEDGGVDATLVQTPAGSNLLGVSPALGSLTDNGGTTQTRLPGPASPVIDAGRTFSLTADQRGFARPADAAQANAAGGDGSDIGAVELRVPAAAAITSGPDATTTDTAPTFAFVSAGALSLSCSLDGAPFTVCSSPVTTAELADGDHTFRVRGNGPDGAAGVEASVAFTVDTALDGVDIDIKKKQKQKGEKIKLKVNVGADEDVDATAKGTITVKGENKKFKLKKASAEVAAGEQRTLKLKPKKKKDSGKILDLIADGEKLTAKLSATLTDALGNTTEEEQNVKLKGG